MTNTYMSEVKSLLTAAIRERNHPLKFCVLGTTGLDNTPESRIIGLRDVSEDYAFTLFTDERSNKVSQIKKNPQVSLLFYHPEEKIQIKVKGTATIVKDENFIKEKWLEITCNGRKDYTTTEAPGTIIKNNEEITFLKEKNYFCIVKIASETIEYLKLRESSHFKVQFYHAFNGWVSQFLVP
ncbi:pyridoxamine 5'-phosphate oxidase family protein [Aurantibacter sp.]|uniref:pyridoxamine 5'-phosphate oxidase family protein n=1 Tax=Aurantibacter sp. TaxID=2807103 RepID=UPI003264A9BA